MKRGLEFLIERVHALLEHEQRLRIHGRRRGLATAFQPNDERGQREETEDDEEGLVHRMVLSSLCDSRILAQRSRFIHNTFFLSLVLSFFSKLFHTL